VASTKNPKKRDRDEYNSNMQNNSTSKLDEMQEIDLILAGLRKRVLLNETLNSFKKEVSQIADLVDRRDPQWNSIFSTTTAQKLSQILQKSHHETLFML
jgi:hypothetical protein